MVVERAQREGASSVVLTFDPHPALVHRPDQYRGQIMGTSDKLDAMEQLGVDAVLVQHYDLAFASQDPLEFMRRYLLRGLRACCVVVGADARFGRGNQGDVSALRRFGAEHGFDVVVVEDLECCGTVPAQLRTTNLPLVGVDGPVSSQEDTDHDPEDRRISSTWIRERLIAGDVEDAARLLGRPHRMRGTVVHGAARGRELGFPRPTSPRTPTATSPPTASTPAGSPTPPDSAGRWRSRWAPTPHSRASPGWSRRT